MVKSIYRILMIVFLIWLGVSCVSIRNNYLGTVTNSGSIVIPKFISSEKKKQLLQSKTDSLLLSITVKKKQKNYLKAKEINQLHSAFGQQLNNDRYSQYLLKCKAINLDHLSEKQYVAALELLSSAANYEQSYQKNKTVRRNLNRGDLGNNIPKHILHKSRNFLYSPSVRKTLKFNCIRFYGQQTDSLLNRLPKTNTCIALRNRVFRNNDRIHSILYTSAYAGSYVVGNTIGLFHKKTNRERNAKLLGPQLQPFDLVVMKSPHHLTDQFIPGYFGHVGIWLGSDLASRLTNKSAKKDDSKGRVLVEVLRSGVKISALKEFCDGDLFLIIRPTRLTSEQKETILSNTRKQLPKDYDFNFDIESPEAITCTELVYLTYDFIDWQVRYTWSRYTLSPDDLAYTALKNDQFEFPVFIENGSIKDKPDTAFIRSLVGLPVNIP